MNDKVISNLLERKFQSASHANKHQFTTRNTSLQYDVFISHNSIDKPIVRKIVSALKDRGLNVWLDELELVPGRPWQEALEQIINNTKSALVCIGKNGLGPWEKTEMRSCISQFVTNKLPVIPVLLPGASKKPVLPVFLKIFKWVDLRKGFTEEGLNQLIWGITANNPDPKSTLQIDAIDDNKKTFNHKDAIDIWKEKLDYYLKQQAIISDPAQKFTLDKLIEEAKIKISELE